MKIFHGGRQSGKTTDMIKEASKYPESVIVCHNHATAKAVKDRAREMGASIGAAVSIDEFMAGRTRGMNTPRFYFDNIDLILSYISMGRVGGMSFTDKEVQQEGTAKGSNNDDPNITVEDFRSRLEEAKRENKLLVDAVRDLWSKVRSYSMLDIHPTTYQAINHAYNSFPKDAENELIRRAEARIFALLPVWAEAHRIHDRSEAGIEWQLDHEIREWEAHLSLIEQGGDRLPQEG